METTNSNSETMAISTATNEPVPAAEPKTTDTPGPIPYDRFKAVNDKNSELSEQVRDLAKKLADRETAEESARKAQLKDQEKYKELVEEYEGKVAILEPQVTELQTTVTNLTKMLEDIAAAQVALVPELYRPIIDKLPVLERLQWLTENADKLAPTDKPKGVPPTPKGQGKGDISPEERRRRSPRTF